MNKKIMAGMLVWGAPLVAMAQSGTLTYAPAAAAVGTDAPAVVAASAPVAVPIPALLLLPLGLALALVGYRTLRSPQGRKLLSVMLLGSGLALGTLSILNIPSVTAQLASILLSNPEGDTIDLPIGEVKIRNTSGVALTIGAISLNQRCATQAPVDECESGRTLDAEQSCNVDYTCAPQQARFE